jgi:Polyketide cyclase / dehydrase and lipid transport
MTSTPNVTRVDSGPRKVTRRVTVAATPAEVFDLLADPRRHGDLDGSGTVHDVVAGPERLGLGDRFSVGMTFHGVPYRITSRVIGFEENALLEWQHPFGHRWRWEFAEIAPGQTQVTETWDYLGTKGARWLELGRYPQINAKGIRQTLEGLRSRFAARSA